MSVVVQGDEKNQNLLRATHGSVAIWKGLILITSEDSLYYCDISEYLGDKKASQIHVHNTSNQNTHESKNESEKIELSTS